MVNNKKILIAEDDRSILEVVTIILEDAGYTVYPAVTSQDFFEKLSKHTPDLLLLDIWLSGEDGGKIARELKKTQATAHIPVVLISANAETEKIAADVGADGFLLKPFDIEALLNIVGSHTGKKNPESTE